MGKWTHNYTDEVLHAKVSALVTGAIRRSASENPGALPPTYSEFVHELDTGDSFTTTMIDILVKEVMERRKRPTSDRRFISDRTAKSLRLLSGTLNIYHGRAARINRYTAITRPSVREGFYVDTDEDDFDLIPEDPSPAEGSHMSSSELLEAMSTRTNLPMASTSMADNDSSVPPPPLVLPPRSGRASPWTALPATSTNPNTTRTTSQQSLRRPGRTRNSELADFFRRPRPGVRAALGARQPSEVVTEPRDDNWVPMPSTAQRRFFSLTRLRHQGSRTQTSFTDGSGDEDGNAGMFAPMDEPSAGPSTSTRPASMPQAWAHGDAIYVSPRAVMLRDIEPLPPLRRGGVLPPEAMFPQIQQYMHPTTASPTPELGGSDPLIGEPAAYPTPGSVDNEQST